ncbi:Mu transposase C-terminal domain-containing protein [Roseovarius sp. D0-M9]|uniref:Mu transposase C-terminal domain-containing protein n=1 Tax=Roseovarius sp. D0-M9 TaxID=3127117 RepID=UPI0030105B4F
MTTIFGATNFATTTSAKCGFRIEQTDRITIEGTPFDMVGQSGDMILLQPSIGNGLTEQFTRGTLSRLSAAGAIKHEVGYYLPDDLKIAPGAKNVAFHASDLNASQRKRFHNRFVQIRAIEDMVNEGSILPRTGDIRANASEVEKRAASYLKKEVTERDLLDYALENKQLPDRIANTVRKSQGGSSTAGVKLYTADYLRKLYSNYQKVGLSALTDDLAKAGNRTGCFKPKEQALLMDTIRKSYLTLERKTLKATVVDVKRAFRTENEGRAENDQLRVPGRDAVRGAIKKLGALRVMIARFGREYAIKKLRPVGKGLEVLRPGQRVEMDEWCIDLQTIIHSANLEEFFGADFLETIGLNGGTDRWWLVLAIDCRTKVVLGMKLTRNPCGSAAQECLRMVVSDKGQWADAVGDLAPWSQAVRPEVLATDNGPAFKSQAFTDSCLDLGITALRTHAGVPGMRGTGERIFGTFATDLMPRLKGRTFSNSLERGDYKSEDRACLDADDLAFILVRWVVCIYHNSEHGGLGGRTPLEQWNVDMEDGNYPVSGLPDTASKRLAFGQRFERKVSQEGIVMMGIRYHSPELGMYFMGPAPKLVDVRWDGDDLGAISVFIDGAWQEVPAVHDRFAGMHFHVWMKTRRALRAKSASRQAWNEETVFKAIDQIEALVENRSDAFGLIDTTISDQQFKAIEQDFFSTFRIDGKPQLQADGKDLGSVISPRAPDPDTAPSGSRKRAKSVSVKPSPDVEHREQANSAPATPQDTRTQAPKFGMPRKREF